MRRAFVRRQSVSKELCLSREEAASLLCAMKPPLTAYESDLDPTIGYWFEVPAVAAEPGGVR